MNTESIVKICVALMSEDWFVMRLADFLSSSFSQEYGLIVPVDGPVDYINSLVSNTKNSWA